MSTLKVRRLSENAVVPTKGSPLAAGFDLSSAMDTVVPTGGRCVISTDLAIEVPEGTYGRVAPRSGLAVKIGLDVGAGVIDRDYRGVVGVVLFNHGNHDFLVRKGDRIAQLILEKIDETHVVEVVDELEGTLRGDGGFGSTGV